MAIKDDYIKVRVSKEQKKLQEIKLKLESQSSKKKSLLKNFFYDIIKYRFIGRYSRMASYKKGIGTTQNQLKHECSNRATATEKI